MTRAWSQGVITGTSKGLQLLRYPRSKPICATRPVSEHDQPHMRSPLIAAAPRSRFPVVKGRLRGKAQLVGYIDDFVICFQYRSDAIRVQECPAPPVGKVRP